MGKLQFWSDDVGSYMMFSRGLASMGTWCFELWSDTNQTSWAPFTCMMAVGPL